MKIQTSNAFKIHSNCVFVHGYKSSTFCDLFRLRYKSIPVKLANLIESLDGIPISNYTKIIDKNELNPFLDFISQLEQDDYISFINPSTMDFWMNWNSKFDFPGHISSAIFNIDCLNKYDILDSIKKANLLGCEAISIISSSSINFETLLTIINQGTLNSSVNMVEIYIPLSIYLSDSIIDLLKKNKRYTNLYFSKIQNPEVLKRIPLYNLYQDYEFTNSTNKNDFKVNPLLYNESLKYNTYYHKKLIIDTNGNILL